MQDMFGFEYSGHVCGAKGCVDFVFDFAIDEQGTEGSFRGGKERVGR